MPVAYVTEFDVDADDRSTSNYDAVHERLGMEDDRPAGLIVHAAGFTGDGIFRIFNVWDTAEQAQQFYEERLMPVVQSRIEDAGQPDRQYSYELHHLVS